ncbi:uncharacterized protein [Dysidea avara]|uniref:uncharacterized protein isoform X1 n=1 Tax=Dysidea avara TaxID=196820 RepID=UPI003317E82C
MKNKDNKTPLDIAKTNGHHKVVQLLESYPQKRKSLLQKINEAKKKHGTIAVRFIKILFTGSGAAGKTSFGQLLLNRKINQEHHSTNMVHTSHAVSLKKAAFHKDASDKRKVVWVEMDSNLEIKHLHTVLLSESKRSTPEHHKQTDEKSDGNLPHDTQPKAKDYKPQQLFTAEPIQKQTSLTTVAKHWFSGLFTKSINVKNLSVFQPILTDSVESSNDSPTMHHPGDVLNIVTLLDTGGQPQYIHLLPTVNIYPTINFVIHDLSKDLNDQVLVEHSQHGKHTFQPYHLSYTNLDMIKLLMSSNNDCLERPSLAPNLLTHPGTDKNSYLCFVGTHVDKVSKETVQKTDNTLTALVNKASSKASVLQHEGNVLFPVNNTTAGNEKTEDPIADVIRNKIEKLAENKNVYELPITWMLLELEIRQVCTKNMSYYISFKECVALAKASRLMSNPEEVKNALIYHHLLGVLLFFDDIPGLKEYVIVDHQWWFDKLSNIISFTFQDDSLCLSEVLKLKHKGILCREVLQKVEWDSNIKEEYFLSLLVHLKIIAPLLSKGKSIDEYFIPYILPTCSAQQKDEIIHRYGYLQGEPLLIQFQSGLLPRGLFCCLVVYLLQNPPLNWHPHFTTSDIDSAVHHTFSNLITYSLPNGFSLLLFDSVTHLEVQIRHPDLTDVSSKTHCTIFQEILHSLELVCKQLTFSPQRLQVGFYCNCGENSEPHLAVLPEITSSVLYGRCSSNSVKLMKLTSSHLVWFKKDEPFTTVVLHSAVGKSKNPSELRVFKQYYSKLVDCLPAKELSHYLVSQGVITLMDNEDITCPTTSRHRAAELLLSRVSTLLQEDNVVPFQMLLDVMQKYGNDAIVSLSSEIQRLLNKHNEFTGDALYPATSEPALPINLVKTSEPESISCQSAEYTVILEFYSKLVDVLQVKSLAPYLIEGHVFIPQDGENVGTIASRKQAAEFLLTKISAPLKAGFKNCSVSFYKFLDIAKQHGNADTVQLCDDIEERLVKMKLN